LDYRRTGDRGAVGERFADVDGRLDRRRAPPEARGPRRPRRRAFGGLASPGRAEGQLGRMAQRGQRQRDQLAGIAGLTEVVERLVLQVEALLDVAAGALPGQIDVSGVDRHLPDLILVAKVERAPEGDALVVDALLPQRPPSLRLELVE